MVIKADAIRKSEGETMMRPQPSGAKQISVSEKRQITIPKRFYEKLGMTESLICELRGDEIVLRPAPTDADFSQEILKDLIQEGYEGEQLLKCFQKRKAQIRPAVESLITEADEVAQQFTGTGDEETESLFGDVRE
ncbi:AbrB/MazE/SpoVT family DNA-binding domain-containing protein [Lentibacillus cibarius]|uniref:AbrB/MazE/SpoVT family DNA-binding domain-containing protein n=1 Tax=Lentibacillus cibarius TaxID=2583219 RepID=UPI001F3BF413|nr:AbrB/MazE/SpoVT family DNA-binding domain-containing protein [Lentibacillus cibarius]